MMDERRDEATDLRKASHTAAADMPSGFRVDTSGRVALAGFLTTAVTFGPARSAFGLFVPDIRETFDLSTGSIGLVAALGYVGFFAGLVVALRVRRERSAVIIGAVSSGVGLALVASAPTAVVLGVGVVVASSSAGLTWATFNGIVDKVVEVDRTDSTLTDVSTGTAFGLAATGLVALAFASVGGLSWRWAWVAFAVAGAFAVAVDVHLLPRTRGRRRRATSVDAVRSAATRTGAIPLLCAGVVVGIANSAWLSFAVDVVVSAGGADGWGRARVGPGMFVVLGLAGLVALITDRIIGRWGLRLVLRSALLALTASLVMIGARPGRLTVALMSAGVQGIGIMTASACLAAASLRLHRDLPLPGFTSVLAALAVGNVVGASATGWAAGWFGLPATLVVGGLGLAVAAVLTTRQGMAHRARSGDVDGAGPDGPDIWEV